MECGRTVTILWWRFSFSGTVILGALSLHQNEIIKQESDKRIAIQEKREHDSNMPRFRVKFCIAMEDIVI